MKPEFNSRRLFGITRSKGKMYEFGLPEESHIAVPAKDEPEALFVLAIGILGDAASEINKADNNVGTTFVSSKSEALEFSASYFDAFLASRFRETISRDATLLAASAYYLSRRPGSSLVLAQQLQVSTGESSVDKLLCWVLKAEWSTYLRDEHPLFGNSLQNVSRLLAFHFSNGSGSDKLISSLAELRQRAYEGASARELLFVDIISAIVHLRLAASAWVTLPHFTQISAEMWSRVIRRPEFPKELWPAQILLGQAGLFSGASGVIQMPTSAGKTKSIEIVLRSGFLAGRTSVAIVVAPFRALCHEIGTSLRYAFREDDVKINELSDALQMDFLDQIAELLGTTVPSSRYVLILTPEKFLYVLRQTPALVDDVGIVVYDEGHQFDSGSRGITYELLLTEIKALLPTRAQTILISAVIQNAKAVGQWLIGESVQVINGSGLLPTARSVAFASWMERLGQLMFFESGSYFRPDYFVPRSIEQQKLARQAGERKDRYFPDKSKSNDVALYLGVRLAPRGAVAIFCGGRETASGIATRAVEIFERGYDLQPPSNFAGKDELKRLKNLVNGHFGVDSVMSSAAALGVFVHHGNTPHGLRLSIEYGMQQGRINFVACTSTLAQGVNLPIRYLIVSGIYQAGERIKIRDFQNLIGRAGRAGMHTEGLVIFADPKVYDGRVSDSWRFNASVELLSPERAEDTSSSLLSLLEPFRTVDGRGVLPLPVEALCGLILSNEEEWILWANNVVGRNPSFRFETKKLVTELRRRRSLLYSVESYLMANRGTGSFEEFTVALQHLATATLAYYLANDEEKAAWIVLFSSLAQYLQAQQTSPEQQAVYAKTLLGIRSAKQLETWVNENRELLLTLDSNDDWLAKVWPVFIGQLDEKFFHTVEPSTLPHQLALRWLQGASYRELFLYSELENGTKAWGEQERRRLTDEEIINFCENTLGFQCSLILAAVAQFLFEGRTLYDESSAPLRMFQKSLKYGLPDWLSISCYEYGFSDRVVAQRLCDALQVAGYSGTFFGAAIEAYQELIETILLEFPSYFETVLSGARS